MTENYKVDFQYSEEKVKIDTEKYGFGTRHVQCLLIFFAVAIALAMRVNLSIAIVAMNNYNNFKIFSWDQPTRSLIISSFYWGYIFNQVPGGKFSQKYGCKYILIFSILLSSVLTILTPLCTILWDWKAFIALRVGEGFAQGVLFPSVHAFLAQWVAVDERHKLGMFCYSGVTFGTAVMLISSGFISTSALGWPGIFYISGSCGILWCILWFIFGSSRPSENRSISEKERQYIESSLGNDEDSAPKHLPTPWKHIFTSKAFYALLIAIMANAFGFIVLLTQIPTYTHAVLGLDINKDAVMSSLPYFFMWILSYAFAFFGDFFYKRGLMSVEIHRKFFNSIGECVPAAALIGLSFVTKAEISLAVIILTVAVGFNAATNIGCVLNHIDLAPNHAGILMGMTNGMAGVVNIITPIIVGQIVSDVHNQSQWQIIFFMAAAIFFVGNLIFVVFGSATEQNWNDLAGKNPQPRIKQRRSSTFAAPFCT